MSDKIDDFRQEFEPEMIHFRRAFHRHAESGWTGFWTSVFVADMLNKAGYTLKPGKDILHVP